MSKTQGAAGHRGCRGGLAATGAPALRMPYACTRGPWGVVPRAENVYGKLLRWLFAALLWCLPLSSWQSSVHRTSSPSHMLPPCPRCTLSCQDVELALYDSWFDPMIDNIPSLVPDGFIYLRTDPGVCMDR